METTTIFFLAGFVFFVCAIVMFASGVHSKKPIIDKPLGEHSSLKANEQIAALSPQLLTVNLKKLRAEYESLLSDLRSAEADILANENSINIQRNDLVLALENAHQALEKARTAEQIAHSAKMDFIKNKQSSEKRIFVEFTTIDGGKRAPQIKPPPNADVKNKVIEEVKRQLKGFDQ